jgi:NAD(P)-dependent dehydrogenase (short-subunit alcohol dehydrogenase family)
MSTATRNPTVYWCEPIHHSVSADGPLDPAKTKLHSPFIAVIIGSSRGIGRATALAYAKAGASTVILTGRTQETLSAAVSDVRDAATHPDVDVRGIAGDVCSDTALQALKDELMQSYGRIDALVINAGVATQPLVRWNGGLATGRRRVGSD